MRTNINALLLVLIAVDTDEFARIAGKRTPCNTTGKPCGAGQNGLDCIGGCKAQSILACPIIEIGTNRFGFHVIAIASQNQWREIASHSHLPTP